MLHLRWDHDLKNDQIVDWHFDNYFWSGLPIHPLRAKQVAQFCVEVYESNPDGIPYAFGDPFGAYDGGGKFNPANQRVGLTCSSFVVSLLEQIGVNIVDRRVWRRHGDDDQFFRWIIKALGGGYPNIPAARRPDHCQAVRNQVAAGAVRYKPTEIAGAATAGFKPVSFFEAFMLAGEIKCELPDGHAVPPWLV
jgi:hypothetical protein